MELEKFRGETEKIHNHVEIISPGVKWMESRSVPVSTFIEGVAEGGPLFRIQWNLGQYSRFDEKYIQSIKHRKTTNYPIYSIKLIISTLCKALTHKWRKKLSSSTRIVM